jgi:hypothetical protein
MTDSSSDGSTSIKERTKQRIRYIVYMLGY